MKKETIYLAGGCFWGTQQYLDTIEGVLATKVGYVMGEKEGYPQKLWDTVTYEEVCHGSGHAEAVEVVFDRDVLSLSELLTEFYYTIDPTSLGRQGMDVGVQYRTGIYSLTQEQREEAAVSLSALQKNYTAPVVVENLPLLQFIPAEEYHQKYLEKHPTGYCHINYEKIAKEKARCVDPADYRVMTKEEMEKNLTELQYLVTQRNATEPPFDNPFWNRMQDGIYVDITSGEPMFSSRDKFMSPCGWPSFAKPIDPNAVREFDDLSLNMIRTEVRSRVGNAHLGHVFPDGPMERGGLRYCINSAALRFIPKEEMEQEGYGAFLRFL